MGTDTDRSGGYADRSGGYADRSGGYADRSGGYANRSGGYAKGNARREHIVEVATEFFGRTGYRAATMLQIAEACGISRAGLLHHFPTKEGLLAEVLAARDRDDHARSLGAVEPGDGLGALADLVGLAAHNATIPTIVNLFAVLSAEAGDPTHPAHAWFVRRYENSRAGVTRALVAARDQGALAPDADPASLAVEIVALMDGLQVQWLLAPDTIDMAGQLRRRLDSVLTVPLPH